MGIWEKLGNIGIVPVAVIEDAAQAAPTADAMAAGGIPVIEITLRTKAALASIENVAKNCADVIVGAGTVVTLDETKRCVDAGAQFIVSPGYNAAMVDWCIKNDIPVLPGCVTPTEIMAAIEKGLSILKFFPANVYGGLVGMKALSGPFPNVKFIPTSGINVQNAPEYLAADFIHAVGGSWVCEKADVTAGNFGKITELARQTVSNILGFELAHVGINTASPEEAASIGSAFENAFNFALADGNSSLFASSGVEIIKSKYLGANGHLAIRTCNVARAMYYLGQRGYAPDESTFKYKNGKLNSGYIKAEIGGFAIHLLQK